jgi:hypothetical protein
MSSSLLFVIVGRNEPLYEAEFLKRGVASGGSSEATTRQNYFVLHSSLDLVEKTAWTTSNMYLKVVDKASVFGNQADRRGARFVIFFLMFFVQSSSCCELSR